MDSARSWFKKFQPREKVGASPNKKKEMESSKDSAARPPVVDEAPSNVTKQKVTAAKQYIENHYKSQMKSLQERRERSHLKFPEEAKLSPEAKDIICKLLCNVELRLGTKGAHEIKAHSWFRGVQWEKLYQMEAAFKPEVNDELDTQNFEKFEESSTPMQTSSKSGPWRKMLSSKDVNFVGYTYKNFEIVNDHHVPGIAELKKKSNKPKRPSIKSLFETEASQDTPSQGSFMNLLPTHMEVSESPEPSPHSSSTGSNFQPMPRRR